MPSFSATNTLRLGPFRKRQTLRHPVPEETPTVKEKEPVAPKSAKGPRKSLLPLSFRLPRKKQSEDPIVPIQEVAESPSPHRNVRLSPRVSIPLFGVKQFSALDILFWCFLL